MTDAVIVSAARTAIGTARRGSLVDLDAFDLAKYAVQEALKRSGIPVEDVDDIVLGEVLQGGGDIARYIAVELGMLEVHFAVDGSRLGDIVLAGDLIASSPTVAALEGALRGCPVDASAIDRVVTGVLADPRHFILGVGPARTLTDAIVRGLPR